MSQAAADELQRRLVSFAVKITELAGHLPKTPAGRHVSGQILRSGTSPATNYGEARGAESRADFVHKLRIAVKELSMRQASGCSSFWKLGLEARMAPTVLVENLRKSRACLHPRSVNQDCSSQSLTNQ